MTEVLQEILTTQNMHGRLRSSPLHRKQTMESYKNIKQGNLNKLALRMAIYFRKKHFFASEKSDMSSPLIPHMKFFKFTSRFIVNVYSIFKIRRTV